MNNLLFDRPSNIHLLEMGGSFKVDMSKPFPKRPIDKQIAMEDYEKLRNYPTKEQSGSFVGNRATDFFFFMERKKTPIKNKWSHFTAWNDETQRKRIYEATAKIHSLRQTDLTNGHLIDGMGYLYGTANQFKPVIARYLYATFGATKVLDFSAGWGGRCLGAMSLDIDYTGVDTNLALKPLYEKMIKFYPTKSKINMIFKKAEDVDFSKIDYDFVFTSPPYVNLENYRHMPEYDRITFYEKFLLPVIKRTYDNLPSNKWYCLNVPNSIYDEIIRSKVIGRDTKKIPLRKYYHNGSGNNYNEYIYCWKKR